MVVTHVTTRIRSLAGKRPAYQADFLVDTGAIDCMAPSSELRAAGIKPEGKGRLRNGRRPAGGDGIRICAGELYRAAKRWRR